MQTTSPINISHARIDANKVCITIKSNDKIIAIDTLDIRKASARQRLAKSAAKSCPDIDTAKIENDLLQLVSEISKEQATTTHDLHDDEIDISRIARPDRFITPYASGITVPAPILSNGRPVGTWATYVQWEDGKRERMELPQTLALPNQTSLFFHPQPAQPSPTTEPGWSSRARREWLDGQDTPDPVELFDLICNQIDYYLDLPQSPQGDGTRTTLALWTLLTYVYPAWPAVPYIYVGGPLGSGKSRVFEILSRLVFRPLQSSNMTAPCLFRTIHERGGTLLLDEAERLKDNTPDAAEIRSILLSGYKPGSPAQRLEKQGDSFTTESFDVFGPKAIACIKGLPPALASRCIPIHMFRAAPGSPKPRRRLDTPPLSWQSLRDDLHALALSHGKTWIELAHNHDACPDMTGRNYELFHPLMALASWLQNLGAADLLEQIQQFASLAIDSSKDEQTPDADAILLSILTDDIRQYLNPTPTEILHAAQTAEPDLFRQYSPRGQSQRYANIAFDAGKDERPPEADAIALNALTGNSVNIPRRTPPRRSGGLASLRQRTSRHRTRRLRRIQSHDALDHNMPRQTTGENASNEHQASSQPSVSSA